MLRIDAIHSTLQIATVYNLRVADYHTYFVGCDEWGWSVWAHNRNCTPEEVARYAEEYATHVRAKNGKTKWADVLPAELNNTANQNSIRRAAIQADPNLPVRKTNGGRGGKRDTGDTLSARDMQQGPHIKIGREVRFDHLPGRLSKKAFRAADRVYVNSLTKEVAIIQSVRTTKSGKNAVAREIDAVGDILASRQYAEMVASGWKVNVKLIEAGTGRSIPFAHRLDAYNYRKGSSF